MTRKTVNLCFDLQGRLQLERFLLKSGAFFWRVFNCRKLVRFPRRLASFGPCTKLFVNLLSEQEFVSTCVLKYLDQNIKRYGGWNYKAA
jgi:hypothetical protein